jgi:hypothetical protein
MKKCQGFLRQPNKSHIYANEEGDTWISLQSPLQFIGLSVFLYQIMGTMSAIYGSLFQVYTSKDIF